VELSGTVAIVTGGGTGIGRAVCLDLARANVRAIVVNYSRSEADAESTCREIRTLGCDSLAIRANVAVEKEVRDMVSRSLERYGHLDVLVNNAGTTHFVPHPDLDGLTDQVWDDVLSVNVKGTFYCCRAAATALRATRGAIVNIASMAGSRAAGSSIAYGVSKAGVLQLTRGLALALAPEVRVNAVAPGLVSTRWFRQPFGEEAAAEQERRIAATTPLAAVATPEQVSQVVMGFLRSDLVTGQSLAVDGGKNITY
jgi:NAD(P)-dependent dehydrogenase (short-subunit alcohol dehydrogenase family)